MPGSLISLCLLLLLSHGTEASVIRGASPARHRTRLTEWRFWRSETIPDGIIYDTRPDASSESLTVLKPWILPAANDFIRDPDEHYPQPSPPAPSNVSYAQDAFDDSDWEEVRVPHDWSIKGPFYEGEDPTISGDQGRLPVQGVGWYRRKLSVAEEDKEDSVYLEIDGAMAYSTVWLNGILVGGWPYGYATYQVDLTPHLKVGENQLAIRVDNPSGDSSRWYNGGGIYRNVWLTKVNQVHVSRYGTFVTSEASSGEANVNITVQVENNSKDARKVSVATEVYEYDGNTRNRKTAAFPSKDLRLGAGDQEAVEGSVALQNPKLWGPKPSQEPHLYVAVTNIYSGGTLLDTYETRFGIRSVEATADGLKVNGERIYIQGANQHHDLGAIGAAFNVRAAERQLEIMREVGVNAIRTAHNPPAPELLELTDRMGFLVLDEIFDVWEQEKKESDFSLIFDDWHEPDLRSFLRRDRNYPSIIYWSYGNEVSEQAENGEDSALYRIATELQEIVRQEDPHRLTTASLSSAAPNDTFPGIVDIISLNYQGEGIRIGPGYEYVPDSGGVKRDPQYPAFQEAFPDKLIEGTEIAWSLSTRGTYLFPVSPYNSSAVNDTSGGDSEALVISAYELYSADAGSSPDKVFAAQDENPYVAGGFVWAGWDYLGEPAYSASRSAYSGIVDLAGFRKTRFYQYQARWRPDVRMAYIAPHWTWPDRVGEVTPVHVFSAADEAELFVNNKTQGVLKREPREYRFRWDNVVYEAGEVRVETRKDGQPWATESVRTAGEATGLWLSADRDKIAADGDDLSFVTLEVVDSRGDVVPRANNSITFAVSGPGKIVATDNGYPADLTSFASETRNAFSGLALAIISASEPGTIEVSATSSGLDGGAVTLHAG